VTTANPADTAKSHQRGDHQEECGRDWDSCGGTKVRDGPFGGICSTGIGVDHGPSNCVARINRYIGEAAKAARINYNATAGAVS